MLTFILNLPDMNVKRITVHKTRAPQRGQKARLILWLSTSILFKIGNICLHTFTTSHICEIRTEVMGRFKVEFRSLLTNRQLRNGKIKARLIL